MGLLVLGKVLFQTIFTIIIKTCSARGDKIKWMISDYDPYEHKEIAGERVHLLVNFAIKKGFSIVQDWGITPSQRRKYKIISKKYGIPFLEVNIEASFEVICERFSERIESVKKDAKISLTNPKIMKERYEEYFKTKNRFSPLSIQIILPQKLSLKR